jgi:hypothetical protein
LPRLSFTVSEGCRLILSRSSKHRYSFENATWTRSSDPTSRLLAQKAPRLPQRHVDRMHPAIASSERSGPLIAGQAASASYSCSDNIEVGIIFVTPVVGKHVTEMAFMKHLCINVHDSRCAINSINNPTDKPSLSTVETQSRCK